MPKTEGNILMVLEYSNHTRAFFESLYNSYELDPRYDLLQSEVPGLKICSFLLLWSRKKQKCFGDSEILDKTLTSFTRVMLSLLTLI